MLEALFVCNALSGKILAERWFSKAGFNSLEKDLSSRLLSPETLVGLTSLVATATPDPFTILGRSHVALRVVRRDVAVVLLVCRESAFTTSAALLVEVLERITDNLIALLDSASEKNLLSEDFISQHLSSVVLYLDEMIVEDGLPALLEPNALRALVPKRVQLISLSAAAELLEPLTTAFSHDADFQGGSTPTSGAASGPRGGAGIGFSALLASAPGFGMGTGSGAGLGSGILGCGSAVWWRRLVTEQTARRPIELRLSHIERFHCLVDARSGAVSSSALSGTITVQNSLPGLPHCRLSLKNSSLVSELFFSPRLRGAGRLSFHPSVNLIVWKRSHFVQFIPPDGTFQLLAYTLPAFPEPANKTAVALHSSGPPLDINACFTFDQTPSTITTSSTTNTAVAGKFSISIVPPRNNFGGLQAQASSLLLEQVKLTVFLPAGVGSASFGDVTAGSAQFNEKQQTIVWSFTKLPLSLFKQKTLHCEGVLFWDKKGAENDHASLEDVRLTGRLNFVISNFSLSGLTVDSLEVTGKMKGKITVGPEREIRSVKKSDLAVKHNDEDDEIVGVQEIETSEAENTKNFSIRTGLLSGLIEYHF